MYLKQKKENSEENKYFKYIENESKCINYDLFRKYFNFETPTQLTKKLFEIKDKKKNNDFAEEVKNRWSKLKDEIEEMSENEKKKKKKKMSNQIKYYKLLKRFLNLINKTNQEKD